MPFLAGLFSRKSATARLATNASTRSHDDSTSPATALESSTHIPSRPGRSHPNTVPSSSPSSLQKSSTSPSAVSTDTSTSSNHSNSKEGKLKMPFKRRVTASPTVPTHFSSPTANDFSNPSRPSFISTLSTDTATSSNTLSIAVEYDPLRPPPSKSALYAAFSDPAAVSSSTRSLPNSKIALKETMPQPQVSPAAPAKVTEKQRKTSFFWSKSAPKSGPAAPLSKSTPTTPAATKEEDPSSFNLKSFRHVRPPSSPPPAGKGKGNPSNKTEEAAVDDDETGMDPPAPIPAARPRGGSNASDSSQRMSIAAFREARARSPAFGSSSTTSLNIGYPPSGSRSTSLTALPVFPAGGVVGASRTASPALRDKGPGEERRKRRTYNFSSDESESGDGSEDNEDDEEEPTLTPASRGKGKAKSELGHGKRWDENKKSDASFSATRLGSASPMTLSPPAHSQHQPRVRASMSTSAIVPNAAAKRASTVVSAAVSAQRELSSPKAPAATSQSAPRPSNRRSSLSSSSGSSSASSDDAPLATLLPPRRPGSALSSSSAGNRTTSPSLNASPTAATGKRIPPKVKPLVDIRNLTHPDAFIPPHRPEDDYPDGGGDYFSRGGVLGGGVVASPGRIGGSRERIDDEAKVADSRAHGKNVNPLSVSRSSAGGGENRDSFARTGAVHLGRSTRPLRGARSSPQVVEKPGEGSDALPPPVPRLLRQPSPTLPPPKGNSFARSSALPPGRDQSATRTGSEDSGSEESETESEGSEDPGKKTAGAKTLPNSSPPAHLIARATYRRSMSDPPGTSDASYGGVRLIGGSGASAAEEDAIDVGPDVAFAFMAAERWQAQQEREQARSPSPSPSPRTSDGPRESRGEMDWEEIHGGEVDQKPIVPTPVRQIEPPKAFAVMSRPRPGALRQQQQQRSATSGTVSPGVSSGTRSGLFEGRSGSAGVGGSSVASSGSTATSTVGEASGSRATVVSEERERAREREKERREKEKEQQREREKEGEGEKVAAIGKGKSSWRPRPRSSTIDNIAPPSHASSPTLIQVPSKPFRESPSSSTGDDSSGRAPLTPRDGSDLARNARGRSGPGHQKRSSVSFIENGSGMAHNVEAANNDEERRKERRRSEARNAIELGNVVNGTRPLLDDEDDEDIPVSQARMSTVNPMMSMSMGFPGVAPGGWPAWNQGPPRMSAGAPMLSPMPYMVPPPQDPSYFVAHQQAMAYAKQAYQMAVAQQAMAAAADEWERGSAMGSVYGGGVESVYAGGRSVYGGSSYGAVAGSVYGGSAYGGAWGGGYAQPQRSAVYGGAQSEYGGGRASKGVHGGGRKEVRQLLDPAPSAPHSMGMNAGVVPRNRTTSTPNSPRKVLVKAAPPSSWKAGPPR